MRVSISRALVGSFTLLLLLSMGGILYFAYSTGFRTTRELTQAKVALIVDAVRQHTVHHLDPALQQVRYLGRLVANETLDPGDEAELLPALRASLAAAEQIESVAYIAPDLRTTAVLRGDGRAVDVWYGSTSHATVVQRLRESAAAFWGGMVYAPEVQATLINAMAPARAQGEFAGGFIASVRLDQLSTFLQDLASPLAETPFILSADGAVLAHPLMGSAAAALSRDKPLPSRQEIGDPVLAALWTEGGASRLGPFHLSAALTGYAAYRVEHDDRSTLLVSQTLSGYGPAPWTIGVHFPRQQVARQLLQLRDSALLSLAVLVLAVIATVLIGRTLSRPVLQLGRKAGEIARQRPDQVQRLPRSRISEIDDAGQAFNAMLDGLEQREALRATFGKFVPSALVDSLVADRGMLEPVTREATILYCDIVGFSTLTEPMAPADVVGLLNEYFALLVEPIERLGGVIHQFQGDAVLATFNLPISRGDHAVAAIRAALEIQDRLSLQEFAGGLRLKNRIGINSGVIVGGTVGSQGRLGYTVHGDAVNLAARVEELNKSYGTSLLVTQSSVDMAAGKFAFERVAEVGVRGRRQTVTLYRVAETIPIAAVADPAMGARRR